ncbi:MULTISPECIES: MFS transporter [unclassified Beijerinckia]|uniref:MFS transporter n=1 Tax=unclassified Beijerinckia TaxID=2638183 RepID=UPI0008970237|nr:MULTISPECIES: MFS transporter [unclassified Beijerinckia]MDH7799285.1 nitrate/nitrite transporter NarK [Beijerinckia sp. GAS462]SED44868.1 Nitrate/nitrite transporter NarK [Beijerinckia sp. 28-YEA-48]
MTQSTSEGTNGPNEVRSGAILLVCVLIGGYVISQFFRNSITVIAPDLARELALEATTLSLLASVYYLSFALVQIPLGMAIDRYGARIAMIVTLLVLIVGTFWFVFARGYGDLVAARLVIGIGCSSLLMAPLAIYAERFPPRQFATMAGIHIGAGNIGTLMATAPLAHGAATIGWRGSFFIAGLFACLMTVLIYCFVTESSTARQQRRARAESLPQLLAGIGAVMRIPHFWMIFCVAAMTYPSFAAILALWAGPWMAHVYDMPLETRGGYLLALVAAQIVGLFAWGGTDRLFRSYSIPVALGLVLGAVMLAIPALFALPRGWLLAYLVLCGLAFGFSPVLTAHGRSLFPQALIGRGLALINIGSIGGVFIQQMVTGLVMAQFETRLVDGAQVYPEVAYRTAFGVLAAEVAFALLLYWRVKDTHPDRIA